MKTEHPEDKYYRKQGEAFGRSEAGKKLATHKTAELLATITTYADADAEKKWRELREWFWMHDLSRCPPYVEEGR